VPTEREIRLYYFELHEAARSLGYVSADSFRGSNPFVRIVHYDGKRWVSPTTVMNLRIKLKKRRESSWAKHIMYRKLAR
jgi:hypothetical protein